MRVVIDATYAAYAPRTGTGVYTERLLAALAGSGRVEAVRASNPRRRPPGGGAAGTAANLLADGAWALAGLPARARAERAQVIHHTLPALARAPGVAQVVTVHDLAFERLPDGFDFRYRAYARLAHRAAARHAHAVICVSETTAADVRELWGVPAARIVVAPHGPGQTADGGGSRTPAQAAAAAAGGPFLYVGDDEPRKDLVTLLDAYARYRRAVEAPRGLVLAGALRAGRAEGLSGVRIEAAPSAERLSALYREAVALVHPALYEGFGLTALEAMSAGVPVVAARSTAVLEVCAEAALYARPGDAAALAERLREVAANPELAGEMAARGVARAERYSWAASARRHEDAYSLAVENVLR